MDIKDLLTYEAIRMALIVKRVNQELEAAIRVMEIDLLNQAQKNRLAI
jgi:hypothetical protein